MAVRIVAIGGTTRPNSGPERALRIAAHAAGAQGAEIQYFSGRHLILPLLDVQSDVRTPEAVALVEALREADGVIVASPGYHGTISGLVKNALDYVEDLRFDERPYLHGRAMGCIAVSHGIQAAVGTMHHLREVAHALRAWPTPLGAAICDATSIIGVDVDSTDPHVAHQLVTIGEQVYEFALARQLLGHD